MHPYDPTKAASPGGKNPILIGIYGAVIDHAGVYRGSAGAGKDTVAQMLVDLAGPPDQPGNPRVAIIPLAQTLKSVARSLYDLTEAQVYGTQAEKETVDPRWGLSGRQILQRLGTEVVRSVHPDTWIRATERSAWASGADYVVVPDVRFPNEAAWIRSRGVLLGVQRRLTRVESEAWPDRVDHASEARLTGGFIIGNAWGLDALRDNAVNTAISLFGHRDFGSCGGPGGGFASAGYTCSTCKARIGAQLRQWDRIAGSWTPGPSPFCPGHPVAGVSTSSGDTAE